ncbi:hypothetical protein [Deinococcus rufus]|uniref:Uncharacterized protein n=1 Tax=Deinococcus rufus TaxID=2136097 RepID=A0ABV7Z7U0_9DEIO
MGPLPVYRHPPRHLQSRSRLRAQGLAPTDPPVAVYEFRVSGGWSRCELFDVAQTRSLRDAYAARKRRLAAAAGQERLL